MTFILRTEGGEDDHHVEGFTVDHRFINGREKQRYSIEAVHDPAEGRESPFFTCYLFLMPYFCITREPIQPEHQCPYPAPFVVGCNQAAIQPAYMIRQGMIHYGYQIVFSRTNKIYLTISFHNKKPERHLFDVEYQLIRFQLYDNNGSIRPKFYLDLTFEYAGIPLRQRAPFNKLNFKAKIIQPIPYNQSPVPLLEYTPFHPINNANDSIKWAYYPQWTSIGNLDGIYLGKHFPSLDNSLKKVDTTIPEPHAHLSAMAKTLFEFMPPGRNDYADHWRSIRRNLVTPLYELTTLIHTNPNLGNGYSDSPIQCDHIMSEISPTKNQSTQTEPGELCQIDSMRAIISAIFKANPNLLVDVNDEGLRQVNDHVNYLLILFFVKRIGLIQLLFTLNGHALQL